MLSTQSPRKVQRPLAPRINSRESSNEPEKKIGMARPSYNPLSVLCGIQLCGLPGTLAAIMEPCLALVPTGRPFHSAPAISALLPHRAHRMGFVSVSLPTISGCASQHRGLPRGQRSFLRSTPRPAHLLVPGVPQDPGNDKSCLFTSVVFWGTSCHSWIHLVRPLS